MSHYRRLYRPGGTYFFTVVTEKRASFLCDDAARHILHDALLITGAERPFTLLAMVLLPEHLHAIWTLPDGDADYSRRWAAIKARFTHQWLANGGQEQSRSPSRRWHRNRGVLQRRFWEHCIRDQDDYNNHLDYIHYNPVKHGLAQCPHAWPYSTFHRWAKQDFYEPDWQCACDDRRPKPLRFESLGNLEME